MLSNWLCAILNPINWFSSFHASIALTAMLTPQACHASFQMSKTNCSSHIKFLAITIREFWQVHYTRLALATCSNSGIFSLFSNWNFIQFLNDWQMAKKSVHIYNRACTSSNSGVQPISIYMSSNCLLISSNCSLNSLFFSTRSSFFFSSSASLIVNCSTFFSSCSALTSASRKLREP